MAGDLDAAREQFAALLPVPELVSGPENSDTLSVRNAIAELAGGAGDAAGARDELAVIVQLSERMFGPEHPETLAAWRELAGWTGEAGAPARARDELPFCRRMSVCSARSTPIP